MLKENGHEFSEFYVCIYCRLSHYDTIYDPTRAGPCKYAPVPDDQVAPDLVVEAADAGSDLR